MKIIYIHIGDKFPEYHKDSLKQTQKFYDGEIINIFGDKANEFLSRNENNKKFNKINFLNNNGLGNFWSVTLQRLFILEQIMLENDYNDIIHLENDNLIYVNPNEFIGSLQQEYVNCIAINPLTEKLSTASFIYIPNYKSIKRVNDMIINYLSLGENELKKINDYCMVNEMLLLKMVERLNSSFIKYLPALPKDINKLNLLFDPASYGQFLGGTPFHNPGFTDESHYIGQQINNWNISALFKESLPIVSENINGISRDFRLVNLHIHSKRLSDFTCY